MKKENLKKLNDVLDISDEMIGDEFETSSSIPTVLKSSDDLTTDYDFSRDQYQHLIEKGNTALEELLTIAKEGEAPRAFEVATQLINSLTAATKELLLLQKTKNEIEKKDKSSVRTENKSVRTENK